MSAHPKDCGGPCKQCGVLGIQRFDARVVMVDEHGKVACSTQRTGEHCGHTYYCEFGLPLPDCYEDVVGEAIETRAEAFQVAP